MTDPVVHIARSLDAKPCVTFAPFMSHDIHAAHWQVPAEARHLAARPQRYDWISVSLEPFTDHTMWLDGKVVSTGLARVGAVRSCPRDVRVDAEFDGPSGRMDAFAIYASPSAYATLGLPQVTLRAPPAGETDPWLLAVASALTASGEPDTRLNGLESGYLLLSAFAYCARRYGRGQAPVVKGGLAGWQLRRVLETIQSEGSGGEETTIERLAAEVSLSPYHFIRAFRQSVGTSPHRHLTAIRLERAKRLLETTSLPVSVVAQMCGYREAGALGRIFKREVGLAPNEFRREVGAPGSPSRREPPLPDLD